MKIAILICLVLGLGIADATFGRPYFLFPRPGYPFFPGYPGVGYPGYPGYPGPGYPGPVNPGPGPVNPGPGPVNPGPGVPPGGFPYYPQYNEFYNWYMNRNPQGRLPNDPIMNPNTYNEWYNWYTNRNPNIAGGRELDTHEPPTAPAIEGSPTR